MISHGAVEEALQEHLGLGADALTVVAAPDPKRGEKLCVIHIPLDLDEAALREKLQTLDIPNLWKPNFKDWITVDALPLLGTGKLDFRSLKDLAANPKTSD